MEKISCMDNKNILCFYASEDEASFHALDTHLSELKREKLATLLSIQQIPPGSDVQQTIATWLEQADIILLLISPDFLASDFCSQAMQQSLQLQRDKPVRVVPLLVRPCEWRRAPFAHLQFLPRNGNPITTTHKEEYDTVWHTVVTDLRSFIQEQPFLETENMMPPPNKLRVSRRIVLLAVGAVLVSGGSVAALVASCGNMIHTSTSRGLVIYEHKHAGSVRSVAWSPDGKRVASASDDKTVQVWDAADGGHLFTYMGHTSPMRSVAWSPQNNYIASVSADSLVHVWNAADGNARFALVKSQPWDSSILDTNPEIVNMIAWSPNDQYIAAASYEKDGDGSYNRIYIFSSRNALRQNYNSKGSGSVSSIVWSPNSLRMAYAINENQAGPEPPHIVAIGSVGGGERIFPSYTGHKNTIRTVAWSSDGKLIASAGDESTVHLWNANDKKRLFTYTGHSDIIYAVAWSPIDTEYIASASEDRTVQVWKTA